MTMATTMGLKPERTAATNRNGAVNGVHVYNSAIQDEHRRAGQTARPPRGRRRAVQQPTDVDGQLLRLRPGQQHAEVQRVQEPRCADPPLLFHQLASASPRSGLLARRS